MLAEVTAALAPRPGGLYLDATVGAGGHAAAILEASSPDGRLLGLDRDPGALELAGRNLAAYGERVSLVNATFDRLGEVQAARGQKASGVLVDLGVSSMQLDRPGRGFSFLRDEPLDMRMGQDGPGAAELLARMTEPELARAFKELGEDPWARRIAAVVVRQRQKEPIATTGRLARVVEEALPARERARRKLHPATLVFQALRILVNDELGMLDRMLAQVPDCLQPGGVLAVLSYHSLEDRRVKRAMAAWADPCTCPPDLPVCACGRRPLFTLPGKRARRPSAAEVAANPRARSARLRVAVRTGEAAS